MNNVQVKSLKYRIKRRKEKVQAHIQIIKMIKADARLTFVDIR